MTKTKIEWANFSWNPVWGCRGGCEYCYARRIAKRFWKKMAKLNEGVYMGDNAKEKLRNFEPLFLPSSFEKVFPKMPSRIFVNSMSDIRFWNPRGSGERRIDWMPMVLNRIFAYPQHTFLFLTKFPEAYAEYEFPSNCWLGVSCPGRPTEEMIRWAMTCKNPHFVSIEPLMEEPYLDWLEFVNWVIVGGMTPWPKHKYEWVEKILFQCLNDHVPIFMKDNACYRRGLFQNFPEGMKK